MHRKIRCDEKSDFFLIFLELNKTQEWCQSAVLQTSLAS